MPVGGSGGIYPLLDPQSKSEVGTETEMSKVAEPAVTLLIRNLFVADLTNGNRGAGDSVDPGAVVDGERELQGKKGIMACVKDDNYCKLQNMPGPNLDAITITRC
ncbi:uncharacterized protein LOC110067814 [Orbicella faveolata]|uniref:uncharacterized protein LOC110067814 n=1 Tax=Orbicella faveolata TaxID=48498 RepID=UPI0009E1D443|nr:uncharacterized protein LOC110067814 [Orbicella faveolata]